MAFGIMSSEIVPLAESHFEGVRLALDAVAREKRYLAFIQAPRPEHAYAFYRNILQNDLCHFVALLNGKVVGWCDVLPTHGEARAHVGVFGIGLISSARHQGIGALLTQAALTKAWSKGYLRIELSVRTDNLNAKALYERMGFKVEGVNKNAFLIDGTFYDSYSMALLR